MRGFTLVEVLVSAAILGVLAIGIYGVLNVGNIMYYIDIGMLELQQNARQGMDRMINELREASNIQISVLASDSDRIVFNSYKGTGIQYYRDINDVNSDGVVNQIIRQDPSGSRKVLANGITRLKFSHSSPYLTIEIRADKTAKQRPLSLSLKEAVALRNE
jgi:prepilin-type N-terminal cleavage/methylation domain-containing protein